jgi:hypothetical protein
MILEVAPVPLLLACAPVEVEPEQDNVEGRVAKGCLVGDCSLSMS